MRKRSSFTLLELLTVIAIIIILAGILIPTVIASRERGQITQAKADIANLMTALKSLDADYGKMLAGSGSSCSIGNVSVSIANNIASLEGNSYNAMIAELSAPKNSALTTSVNKRKRVYLEPKKGFAPATAYTAAAQAPFLWRDPWGNPYHIFIKVTKDDELAVPNTSLTVPANVAIYSQGPNGTDDHGCNVDRDSCISSGAHKHHDDIAGWDF